MMIFSSLMSCTFNYLRIILECDVSKHCLLKPLWLESQRLGFNPDVQKRALYARTYILEEKKYTFPTVELV